MAHKQHFIRLVAIRISNGVARRRVPLKAAVSLFANNQQARSAQKRRSGACKPVVRKTDKVRVASNQLRALQDALAIIFVGEGITGVCSVGDWPRGGRCVPLRIFWPPTKTNTTADRLQVGPHFSVFVQTQKPVAR